MSITAEEITRRLTNQPPRTAKVGMDLDDLTAAAIEFGKVIAEIVPPGREQSLAVTHIEEVLFWSKKGVALNQAQVDPEAGE